MKLIAALLAVVLLAPVMARAEDKPAKSGLSTWWKQFKDSLEKSAVSGERKKGANAKAVAAVRGKDQTTQLADPNEPTTIGDAKSRRLAKQAAEDADLLKATQLVEQGKTAEALEAFKAFQKAHPKSHKEDVESAIAELGKAEGGAAAEPAAEPAAEEKAKN